VTTVQIDVPRRRKIVVADAPPLIRMSAGTLLVAERNTTNLLRRAVRDASDRTSGEVTRSHDKRNATLLLLLLMQSQRLQVDLERNLKAAKYDARQAAARRLQIELRAGGNRDAAARVSLGLPAGIDVQATTTSESLAIAWRQRASYETMKARREETSIAEAIADASDGVESNLTRAAATETAQAYNDGHVAAALAADIGPEFVDTWSAMLDACTRCAAMEGETTPVGAPFASGEEPAFVHPRCRCFRLTIPA